ncbi:MAG: radical SAM family heme chaperone HemW [Methylovulum sp.]|uniref:radical SAM family heme chaperone HemW n=1 Tax=Methylovulum sp. TaxID=1916980 RepID=UPI00261FD71F|nr:radical SAM family heme chaperone HemW [Methylovulum sp.]MDD2722961.1 radical SAM family heme chaperone HemW [Methylovulum sp.]MDD5123274.1 radical SAM family heme chaperone HemW [Methylovulum sp.]
MLVVNLATFIFITDICLNLPPLSLYIHIPWCIKKCPYCDFNSHAVKDDVPESQYILALLQDLAQDVALYGITRPISNIFIGGGTPSLFSPEAINRLLEGVGHQLAFADDLELTLEANPGTFESHKFAEFRAIGINRLSIGIQSFNDVLLTKLGRVHTAKEAVRAIEIAHQAGFDNLNLDLMFGLPEATASCSQKDLQAAVALAPTHISFYQLTLEPNTYFHRVPPSLPDDDAIFIVQKAGQALLADKGYQQYEISAYSQTGRQCKHNLNYWQFGDYLGIGAGAHGKITRKVPGHIFRTHKPKSPGQYLPGKHKNNDAAGSIAVADLPLEFVMNHLRLREGFSLAHYHSATGLDPCTLEPALSDCRAQGLIDYQHGHYRCSPKGWDFLDSVLQKFLPN